MAVVVKVVVVLFAYVCLVVLVFSLMRVSALAEPAPSAKPETPTRMRAACCRMGVVPGGLAAAMLAAASLPGRSAPGIMGGRVYRKGWTLIPSLQPEEPAQNPRIAYPRWL